MLHCDVPGIEGRQAQLRGNCKSADLVGKSKLPRRRDRDERGCGRALGKANTVPVFLDGVSSCASSTGRFCVAVCPNTDPNTPMSKLRP